VIYRCIDVEKFMRKIKNEFAVLPADTLYSLSISIHSERAPEIYVIKGRGKEIPVPVGVHDENMLDEYGEINELVQKILSKDWHYLVTMVLFNKKVPSGISGEKVGFRIPKNPILKKIIGSIGPITLTSANRHGGRNPVTVMDAYEELGESIKIYVDCGPCSGIPSTVVDLTEKRPILIREGAVPFSWIVDLYAF